MLPFIGHEWQNINDILIDAVLNIYILYNVRVAEIVANENIKNDLINTLFTPPPIVNMFQSCEKSSWIQSSLWLCVWCAWLMRIQILARNLFSPYNLSLTFWIYYRTPYCTHSHREVKKKKKRFALIFPLVIISFS